MNTTRGLLLDTASRVRETPLWALVRPVYRSAFVQFFVGRIIRRSVGFTAIVGENPMRAGLRGPAPVADEAELTRRYRQSGSAAAPDTFVLYRIIGNDIPPRHRRGQSRENLRFILENEPPLPGCEKRYVVNRIADSREDREIRQVLDSSGIEYIHIPFSWREYATCPWDFDGLPAAGYTSTRQFAEMPRDFRTRLFKRLYRHKNNYVINNNGARNAALEDGRRRAKWVLPWDGNCFLTRTAWEKIREAITARPWYPYVIVPMARVPDRLTLVQPGYRPDAREEPQIIFRADTEESFNEAFYYGRRPKVEMLWRLGVPGPWDAWAIEPWDLPVPDYCPDAGAWQRAGWVARLPSGNAHLETGLNAETLRLGVRAEAVTDFLMQLDEAVLRRRLVGGDALVPDYPVRATREQITETVLRLERLCRRASRFAGPGSRSRVTSVLRETRLLLSFSPRDGIDEMTVAGLIRCRDWLESDSAARRLRLDPGEAGAWYEVTLTALAALTGDYRTLVHRLIHLQDRVRANGMDQSEAYTVIAAILARCGVNTD